MKKIYIFLLMSMFVFSFVSAEWVIPKAKTCEFMNMTGSECDMLWCNIIDCNYNTSLEACVCVPDGYQISSETNWTEISKRYYNRTQVNSKLQEMNRSIIDAKNITMPEAFNETYVDERIKSIQTSFDSKMEKIEDNLKYGVGATKDFAEDIDPVWILVLIAVGVGIFFFVNQQKQKRDSGKKNIPYEKNQAVSSELMDLLKEKNKAEGKEKK